ncbi:aldo/keto reductase [Candidatus Neomarinimicrobiota bacterium]
MIESLASRTSMNDGLEIPWLGLGVYLTEAGSQTQQAVHHALEAGYRHIDTAMFYGNERDVGIAVRNSGLPREEIFVTTKLWNSDHGYQRTRDACNESLRVLDLGYIDLYLIHWPVEQLRGESWRALIELQQAGKCRSIGVSNYTIRHLRELLRDSSVVPAVNQVEFSPFLFQSELLEFCREHGILLEAYSSLTRGKKFSHPTIAALAKKYHKTPAQILIRWTLQHAVVVIPKSVHRERILENADIYDFDISSADMAELDALDENFRLSWDPTNAP